MTNQPKTALDRAFEAAPLPWSATDGMLSDANGRLQFVIANRAGSRAEDALAALFVAAPGLLKGAERVLEEVAESGTVTDETLQDLYDLVAAVRKSPAGCHHG